MQPRIQIARLLFSFFSKIIVSTYTIVLPKLLKYATDNTYFKPILFRLSTQV